MPFRGIYEEISRQKYAFVFLTKKLTLILTKYTSKFVMFKKKDNGKENLYGNLHCGKNVRIQIIFWSLFSRIRIEYGHLQSKSQSSVLIWENRKTSKN